MYEFIPFWLSKIHPKFRTQNSIEQFSNLIGSSPWLKPEDKSYPRKNASLAGWTRASIISKLTCGVGILAAHQVKW